MSLAIAVGILSALSALAGAALNAWFGLIKQSSEEKRWLAEFYLKSNPKLLADIARSLE